MLSESFQQGLKGVAAAAGFVLVGALVALVLSEFQGEFEMELQDGRGYVRVMGPGGQCELPEGFHLSDP
ncbi:MAG: hypothetical protein KME14_17800 [Tildeniella torsiva UHER 1998/13D]|jgi:hypothetical protein|nr:hypothetical protein [Tildeniella torsiva UHER 1998/13D]